MYVCRNLLPFLLSFKHQTKVQLTGSLSFFLCSFLNKATQVWQGDAQGKQETASHSLLSQLTPESLGGFVKTQIPSLEFLSL